MTDRDNIPTLVVTTPDNYLVQVGHAEYAKPKEIGKYAKQGYTIRTMPYKDFKQLNLKWIYDKK